MYRGNQSQLVTQGVPEKCCMQKGHVGKGFQSNQRCKQPRPSCSLILVISVILQLSPSNSLVPSPILFCFTTYVSPWCTCLPATWPSHSMAHGTFAAHLLAWQWTLFTISLEEKNIYPYLLYLPLMHFKLELCFHFHLSMNIS